VSVHPVGEWIISVQGEVPVTLRKLSDASLVTVTHLQSAGFKARKRWSVNGVHMVLALIARLHPVSELSRPGFVGADRAFRLKRGLVCLAWIKFPSALTGCRPAHTGPWRSRRA